MTLESRRIAIVSRRAAHSLGLFSIAASVVVFLAAPFVGAHFVGLLGVTWLLAPVLSYLAIRAARGGAADGGTVALTEDGLRVTQGLLVETFPFEQLEGALIHESVAHYLEIGLRDGDVVSVHLEDVAAGHAFVRRLGSLGLNRRQSIRADQPFLSWAPLSASAGLILWSLLLAASLIGTWFVAPNPLVRVMLFATAVVATWAIVHRRASIGLILGRDGVTLARPFSARFLPWSAIAGTELAYGVLLLRLHDGELLGLSSNQRTVVRTAVLLDRELARFRMRVGDAATAALDRDGRSIEDWRAALVEMARGESEHAYRGAHLSRASLEEVLEDPAARAERRIGAALVLRAVDSDYATRVRLAAESCANEHLRIALEKVADDELDAHVVDDATRAEQA